MNRYLRTDDTEGYAIRVSTNDDSRLLIVATDSGGASFAAPEAAAVMMQIRLGGFRPPGGGPLGGGPRGVGPAGGGRPAGGGLIVSPAAWRIEAKHRSGSLENAVAKTRRANLAVSGATILLMAAALGTVVFLTRRSQALARAQMEFVAGVSHELRTPLSVICSAADNLADGVVTNEQGVRRYGSTIRAEGRRLGGMVEQMLRFAGNESGRAKYHFEASQVEAIVERALTACEPLLRHNAVEVVREVAPGLPAVKADATALAHALRNLLENAVVHGGEGKWVKVSAAAADGGVEIAVDDRGRGVSRAEAARIFEPFYRGKRALEDQIHGFGLGLALVKRIVEAHGGRVSVESAEGRTRFVMRLPVAGQ